MTTQIMTTYDGNGISTDFLQKHIHVCNFTTYVNSAQMYSKKDDYMYFTCDRVTLKGKLIFFAV